MKVSQNQFAANKLRKGGIFVSMTRPLVFSTKMGAIVIAFCLSSGGPLIAQEQPLPDEARRFPSFTWGEFRFPNSVAAEEERENPLVEGDIQQGFDVFSFGNGVFLTPFVRFGYRTDGEGLDWNNQISTSAGMKLRFLLGSWADKESEFGAVIEPGVRFEWQRRYQTGRSLSGFVGFLSWSGGWKKERERSSRPVHPVPYGFVAQTWGNLQYPSALSEEEEDNLLIEGAFDIGINWYYIYNLAFIATFVDFGYRVDTERLDWNNQFIIGVGPRLSFPIRNSKGEEFAVLNIGGKYIYDYHFATGTTDDGLMFFVDWSAWWSLFD